MNISVQRTNSARLRALVVRADRATIATLIPFIVLAALLGVRVPALQVCVGLIMAAAYAYHFLEPADASTPLPWLGWVVGVASLISIAVLATAFAWRLLEWAL